MIEAIVAAMFHVALVLLLAPLVTGFNRAFKARVQTRQGPSLIQPYRDLHKLLRKGMVIPETASWIFSAAPFVLFVTTLLASLLIPTISARAPMSLYGGVLAVVYLLALGRFFLALAGLDTGGSFGGLGSSREMTISAIAEPALMLAIFTVAFGAGSVAAIGAGSTNLSIVVQSALGQSWRFLAPSQMLAFAALFIVLIAETGRIPVDNPATHLELTMIHEAMILEYSGPYLALIEWAAAIKQLVLMTILVNVFFPFGLAMTWSPAAVLLSLSLFILKLLLLSIVVATVEVSNAKMRLFRVPELLAIAFVLGALALVSTFLFQA